MNGQPHSHDEHEHHPPGDRPVDAGSQALAEALRSSFAIIKFVMIALVVVFLASGFFSVGPQQQGILLRFGKPVGEGKAALLAPGLHWSFPYPIDEHTNISVLGLQQVRSSVGWYFTTPVQEAAGTEPLPDTPLNPAQDSYVMTADGNIIHTKATLWYRVENPIRYTLEIGDAASVIQNALNNALVRTAARFNVDDILSRNVAGFQDAVRAAVSERLEAQNVGVTIEDCIVEKSIAPRKLTAAFEKVTNAKTARDKLLTQARTDENQITNQAAADARSIVNLAESERTRFVTQVGSDAANFVKLLPQYKATPDLLLQKRFNETLVSVLSNTNLQRQILPVAPGGKPLELRILLNQELPKPLPPPPPG